MCTGMKDWLAEVEMNGFSKGKYAGKTEGKIEDLTIALQLSAIYSRAHLKAQLPLHMI